MHIIKPLWLKHGGEKKDFEVYSCHVSPDGIRLVTAAGDGYVRIWSTEAIYNGTDLSYTKPKQLASLSYHSGTIHAVRFSGNNKYLASGADDRYVCIYTLDPNPPTHQAFGSDEPPPVENWRIYRRLIGHENDVQDLGWSYDSSILVSVGLDSRVVVWSGYTFEKLKTLSQHGSHVKGITFDPANKYFATASDDRTIRVFRYTSPAPNSSAYDVTNNFMLETTITTPFTNSPLTTYFRRCSWSPDGNHIAGANAVNQMLSTVVIIDRGTWDCQINLVGHEAPVEVCSFSPRMFSTNPPNQADLKNEQARANDITVIACAGQDRGLNVWNTTSSRPLCVCENLALKSISDLAWSPDGENLFFTSLDGTIAVARFSRGELGYPLPLEVNENFLARYGAGRKMGVIEGPEGLVLEEKSKSDELKSVQGRMGELMGDGPTAAPTIPNGTGPTTETNGILDTTTEKSAIVNGTNHLNDQTAKGTEVSKMAESQKEDPDAARIQKIKNRVTITKDGKKRVAPMLISSSTTSESSLPRAELMASNTSNQANRNEAPQTILDLSKPYEGLPKGGIATLILGNKRRYAETGAEDDNAIVGRVTAVEREGSTAIVKNTPEGLTTDIGQPFRPSAINHSFALSPIRLAVPTLRAHFVRPVNGITKVGDSGSGNDDSHILDVKNATGPSRTGRIQDREPARVTVTKKGQVLWQDFLPKAVLLVTGNSRFWAAACDDGSVYTWTPAGRRIFNALVMESQPVILDCRGPFLLCISAVGQCNIWNVETRSSPHPPVSLGPVLDSTAYSQGPHLIGGPGIIFARLTSEGRVVVAMSNGDAYAYSPAMYTWQRLSEPWWAVGSQYWNTSETVQTSSNRTNDSEENDVVRLENISAGVIPQLERNTTAQILLRGRAYALQRLIKSLLSAEGYEGFESGVSVAHLENRLAAALSLGARDEFKMYLSMYAKRLGAEGARLKIEELLRGLLKGIGEKEVGVKENNRLLSDPSQGAPDELCGWKKEVLLKEVVLILGKYRDLQRMTVPYARVLGITSDGAGPDDMETS